MPSSLPTHAIRLLTCAALTLAPGCGPQYEHLAERSLAAPPELSCPGYLVWNHEPVRDVFLVMNGSGTPSNAFVHPTFEGVLEAAPVAYLTYDKPGIRAPFGDPAAVQRDPARFQQYTLGHGIACATHALRWAREQFGDTVRLHLRGHSEGSLVALYTYDALLESEPRVGERIASVVLSGVALEPFADILEHQLASIPGGERLREALAACEEPVLAEHLGVSCAYVADAVQRPPGRTLFERLAARGSAAQFHVFHGTQDWNTPVAPVRELEAWNAAEGHLDLTFHYYEGGHAGSDAARAELTQLLTSIISR